MNEIQFYKDIRSVPDSVYNIIHYTHDETMNAIGERNATIHTTALSALSFSDLLDSGYRIFLHENHRSFECKVGSVVATDKEIRKAHDIRRIWIGGGFSGFFGK